MSVAREEEGKNETKLNSLSSFLPFRLLASNHQHPPFLEIMSLPRPSPLLPWDVIGLIIKANWIEPVDLDEPLDFCLGAIPFYPERYLLDKDIQSELLVWMTVSDLELVAYLHRKGS